MNISHTNIDFNSRMICVVENDIIYEMNTAGQTQPIGHTNNWCDELVNVANEYKQLCIDNGLIEEEKTPEQIMQEQTLLMQEMFKTMQSMKNEIEVLKNGHNAASTTGSKSTGGGQSKSKSSSKPSNTESTGNTDEE